MGNTTITGRKHPKKEKLEVYQRVCYRCGKIFKTSVRCSKAVCDDCNLSKNPTNKSAKRDD